MSLARDMKASPEVLIRSAEASLELTLGLFLARQDRTADMSCMRELAIGSNGSLREAVVPPRELDNTTLKLSGINNWKEKMKKILVVLKNTNATVYYENMRLIKDYFIHFIIHIISYTELGLTYIELVHQKISNVSRLVTKEQIVTVIIAAFTRGSKHGGGED